MTDRPVHEIFTDCARMVYGGAWAAMLSRDTGKNMDSIRQWALGQVEIPNAVFEMIIQKVESRRNDFDRALEAAKSVTG